MKPEIEDILRALIAGEEIEYFTGNNWCKSSLGNTLTVLAAWEYGNDTAKLRIKPKTIQIGRYTVPEPMRVPPPRYSTYYYVDLTYGTTEEMQGNTAEDESVWLANGMLQATKEGAEQQLAALLSLTRKPL